MGEALIPITVGDVTQVMAVKIIPGLMRVRDGLCREVRIGNPREG